MKPKTGAVVLFLVTSMTTQLQAQNVTVEMLSKEPVNMLEYGMFRLEQYVQRWAYKLPEFDEANVHLVYNEESDKINIVIRTRPMPSDETLGKCTEQIELIRDYGGVDVARGTLGILDYSIYSTFFLQANQRKSKETLRNIDEQIRITCMVGRKLIYGKLVSNEMIREQRFD